MTSIKKTVSTFIVLALILSAVTLAPLAAVAHDVLYPGTVLTIEAARIEVNTIDQETKKQTPMWFEIDADTKVKRGETLVPYAKAQIRKDERIVVVVNHDDGGTAATELRLAPAR